MNFREHFIEKALTTLLKEENNLTDWEKDFYHSIKAIHKSKIRLSQKQYNTLQEIYQKYRS